MKRPILTLLILLAVLVLALWLLMLLLSSDTLEITTYRLATHKLSSDLKIALLSDLHNREFGEGNCQLIAAIRDYDPDLILICGDMVTHNEADVHVALELCEALVELTDVYYVYGNHEGALQYDITGLQIPLDKYLRDRGVHLLGSQILTLEHGADTITLMSKSARAEDYLESPSVRDFVDGFLAADTFKLAMGHYPDFFYDALYSKDFDLAVAGHYHGGQIVLPVLGGLYHGDTGLFPQYYGGEYPLAHGTLIVSRGLGNTAPIPRINNNPELVFINVSSLSN